MKKDGIHLAIIGGGSAAFAAAIKANELGARVTVINDGLPIGGTCVNVGCVPSKAMLAVAKHVRNAAHSPFAGVGTAQLPLESAEIADARAGLVRELRQSKYKDILSTLPNVTFIQGRAVFQEDGFIQVGDTTLQADKFIIATGTSPSTPQGVGLEGLPYWTSTEALEAAEIPESLLVWGAGFVGLELAQAYARLGAKVTVIARSRLLSYTDPDISEGLRVQLEKEGINIILQGQVEHIRRESGAFTLQGRFGEKVEVSGEELLVATGRHANTQGLGLEHVGVELDERGNVIVDEKLRTSQPHIFAVGDVSTLPKFVYVAAYSGKIAAENALVTDCCQQSIDLTIVPEVVFTDPQIALVGKTQAQAEAEGIDAVSAVLPMEYVPRAIVSRRTDGLVKLVAERESRKLLGAQILAEEAGEMIQPVAVALKAGMTYDEIAGMLHPYLTWAEALKLAAQGFTQDVTKLSCCAA
tara:strand:+ start:3890 stop:5299 length:1410 start_codon:yes stop_codon:yes gene_type:complete